MQETLSGRRLERAAASKGNATFRELPKKLSMPRFFASVRARVLLLMLLPSAALIGVTVYYELAQRDADQDQAREALINSAGLVAQNRNQSYASTRNVMATMTGLPEVRAAVANPEAPEVRAACYDQLQRVVESLSPTLGFGVFDAQGSVICSSLNGERGSVSVADRLDFKQAAASGEFAVGEVVMSRSDPPQAIFSVSMPVLDAFRNVLGVLRLGAPVTDAQALVAPTGSPDGTVISIVDRNGLVMASSNSDILGEPVGDIDLPGLQLDNSLASAIVTTTEGSDRKNIVTRATDAANAPVYAVMSVPPSALTVPLWDALWPEVPIVLAISLATLAGAWVLGDFLIARKASELAESARRIRQGDFAYVASVPQDKSELGQVGVAFGEMADQLDTTIAQLQKAVRAKDEFLSLVSHELRTPVTTILGNSQVLVSRWQTLAGEQRLAAVEDVLNDSQRLKRIIENLLVLARLDTGHVMEVEPILIRRAIAHVIDMHRQQHPGRTYDLVLPADLSVVDGNMQCIEQVLDNMLSNAEKYSPLETPITVRMVADETTVTVAVEDQGIGLDPAEAEELFTPFYRSSRTAHYSGVGLGLSVCQRLVEAQGGTISARANDGRGSVFSFTLPVTERITDEPNLEPDGLTSSEDALVPA